MVDWRRYSENVLSENLVCGELAKLAVARQEKWKENPEYYFDEKEVDRVLKIFSLLKHTSGDYGGKPFRLLDWQAWVIAQIFGWKKKSNGKRVIRKCYVEVAKKNGKTEIAAAIGLILAFFDGEFGSEVYSGANKMDQAKICWLSAATMARFLRSESKSFAKRVELHNSFNNSNIFSRELNSWFKPISSDSSTLDGLRPHGVIIDEFHEAKDDSVLRNMESGMVNRSQPLLFIITTAGFNVNGPCAQYRKVIEDLLRGTITDDSTFGIVFSLDEKDDWNDSKNWIKANPSIGITPTWDSLEVAYVRAKTEGSTAEVNFKTKNQNIWVRSSKTWITDDEWMSNQAPINENLLDNRLCFGALDLSSSRDLTCHGLLFPPEQGGKFEFILRTYIPEESAENRAKRDRVPYMDWAAKNLCFLTPGNVTDQDFVRSKIVEDANRFDIESMQFDPWQSSKISVELTEMGMKCAQFAQTVTKFNEPVTMIEKLIATGNLNHGGHEILRWMAGNVVIKYANGLCRPDKDKSREKIDGIVVMAMCFGGYLRWLAEKEEDSPYNTEERPDGFYTL